MIVVEVYRDSTVARIFQLQHGGNFLVCSLNARDKETADYVLELLRYKRSDVWVETKFGWFAEIELR